MPTFRRRRRWPYALGALVLALSVFAVPTVWLRPWSIHHFYLRTLFEFVWQSPMICSSLHLLDFRKSRLDDFSIAQKQRSRRMVARDLEVRHGYDRDRLPPQEQLSYDVMDWFLRDLAATEGFGGPYALDQLNGPQVALPAFLTNQHALAN